ncbi:hypothetical protein PR003_g3376 [Phytophthora rubi]|uniref:Uncharacterized protein n=3 Tax=Phytophthora rubi TaxID=129364 RepID=A0A6A3NM23_9STRA|nr:hypothetical protein PR001_g4911 [Phytophthora rubi]KAE9046163.1 hypothetical protein PR002_g1811 [Phytophthora rubi]KAE9354393.1 hypothetical protein PR003_g3376 [Phytophthora rubi]
MELKVTLVCGRDYRTLELGGAIVKKTLFDGTESSVPASRGICWNPLTRNLLVCDAAKCCVRGYGAAFNPDDKGQLRMTLNSEADGNTNVIGSRGSAPGQFLSPVAVAVNMRGEIAVADGKLNRVQIFSGSGDLEHVIGRSGTARGEFRGLTDVKFTPRGYIAIVDSGNHRIQVMTVTGIVVQVVGRYGWKLGDLMDPCALAVNAVGDLFVCDEGNKRIQRFSAAGKPLLEWGSRRGSMPDLSSLPDGANFTELRPVVYSLFDKLSDIVVGLHGEVIVCDAGRRQLLVFSDVGACLHVVDTARMFQSSSPTAITVSSSMLVVVGRSLASKTRKSSQISSSGVLDEPSSVASCMVAAFPPETRRRVGRFEAVPVHCAEAIACYLTYADALHVRLVSHYFHYLCRQLRNEWKFYPLHAGQATVIKYNRVVSPATGLMAVEEAFQKWGLRIYKPSNRIRKHVMDFQAGFCSALSTLYGPLFCYQHEAILRAFFKFYSDATKLSAHKEEIDKSAFFEIVTQIEEVRGGFRTWEQCTPFSRISEKAVHLPTIRSADNVPKVSGGTPIPKSLRLVENAQQHQLFKLLQKFLTL